MQVGDCSARSMYSIVMRRAQRAGTAPCLTMAEQIVGSTSANRVRLRAASSISCELCSAFSKETCKHNSNRSSYDYRTIKAADGDSNF